MGSNLTREEVDELYNDEKLLDYDKNRIIFEYKMKSSIKSEMINILKDKKTIKDFIIISQGQDESKDLFIDKLCKLEIKKFIISDYKSGENDVVFDEKTKLDFWIENKLITFKIHKCRLIMEPNMEYLIDNDMEKSIPQMFIELKGHFENFKQGEITATLSPFNEFHSLSIHFSLYFIYSYQDFKEYLSMFHLKPLGFFRNIFQTFHFKLFYKNLQTLYSDCYYSTIDPVFNRITIDFSSKFITYTFEYINNQDFLIFIEDLLNRKVQLKEAKNEDYKSAVKLMKDLKLIEDMECHKISEKEYEFYYNLTLFSFNEMKEKDLNFNFI